MAFITKAEVKAKNEALKAINKKYGVTARFSGSNSSSLDFKATKGSIDFMSNWYETVKASAFNHDNIEENYNYVKKYGNLKVNHYYMDRAFSGIALEYLREVYTIMLDGHSDDSDIMTDYFNCSWYNSMQIGEWNKPYVLVA